MSQPLDFASKPVHSPEVESKGKILYSTIITTAKNALHLAELITRNPLDFSGKHSDKLPILCEDYCELMQHYANKIVHALEWQQEQ